MINYNEIDDSHTSKDFAYYQDEIYELDQSSQYSDSVETAKSNAEYDHIPTPQVDKYISNQVAEDNANREWGLREIEMKYMPADLEEKHELHKSIDRLNETLSRIASSLDLIAGVLDNMDSSFTGITDAIENAALEVAESVDELNDED